MKRKQRGNFFIGLIVGLVLGLGAALGVAVYVTKVPVPFMTKTQRSGAEQDEAEARKNRDWDPNGPLATKPSQAPSPPPGNAPNASAPAVAAPGDDGKTAAAAGRSRAAPAPVEANAPPSSNAGGDPLGDLARSRGAVAMPGAAAADPFLYFVQVGAFRSADDAEAQRAKLSLMGVEARVTERDQAGRTVFRVRAGPFNQKGEADRLKERLDSGGLESALVRVQR
jgi:cell division protein FtsN